MNIDNTTTASDLLVCEELFMLLLRDDGKRVSAGLALGLGLSAAVVADARQYRRVHLDGAKNPRVCVVDDAPTGQPVLDHAVRRLADKNNRRLESTVSDGKLDPTNDVVSQLEAYGMLVSRSRLIGSRFEVRDPRPASRERLTAALVGAPMSWRDSTLLGIIEALGAAKAALPEAHRQLGGRGFRQRMKAIVAAVPEAKAVENVQMYAVAAVVAAT